MALKHSVRGLLALVLPEQQRIDEARPMATSACSDPSVPFAASSGPRAVPHAAMRRFYSPPGRVIGYKWPACPNLPPPNSPTSPPSPKSSAPATAPRWRARSR